MIIRSFHPGMVIESLFLSPLHPGKTPSKRPCVVMAVHLKGLLVHPILPRGQSAEDHAVYTRIGRVACDLRNVIESPELYATVQTVTAAGHQYARADLSDVDFNAVREKSLACAYDGSMKSERLRGDSAVADRVRQTFGIKPLQQSSVTERGKKWATRLR